MNVAERPIHIQRDINISNKFLGGDNMELDEALVRLQSKTTLLYLYKKK
ncbi:hypothetical protein HWA85_gp21 [Clostridium phage CpV1]|uniref:Uncharacterized protein n=1 Tax=Clostridium phage CpV1 TaxID=926066 RepID=E5G074_9CAUD|nr:hypothetical protein HWA85_gp21 [Clostridium phage CpV1]ADR30494.1 hypothetical protein [Clostridium phage CpV1]